MIDITKYIIIMHFFVFLLVPGPPLTLTLDSPSETEMTLHWTPPGQPNGVLIGYLLQYQQSEHVSISTLPAK